jgi:hypothetical protein
MIARLVLIALLATLPGCEKTNHDNIDRWTHTEKGPGKLKKTVADESLDADLSAHAAANLIKMGKDPDVRQIFDQMGQARRQVVIGKLAPRLWEVARIEGDMQMPRPVQVSAKDALVMLRKYSDDAGKQQIDSYLMDWYGASSYEGRAAVGATLGASVVRMIGAPACKKLKQVTDGIIAAPGQDKAKNRLGDELLIGLAASGSPECVAYVLDIAKMKRGDDSLPTRAMSALYKAYVDPAGLFDLVDASALAPNLDTIAAIAQDDTMPPGAANDAVALIRVVGQPACLPALVGMVAHPHPDPRFKYVGANNALKCGGVKAIKDVVHALPDGPYAKDELVGAVAGEIAKMGPKDQVVAALHELMDSKRTLDRWVAIEALAAMKIPEETARIASVKSGDKLTGFWGDQSGLDAKDRKADPTLGQRAQELASGKPSK